MQRANATAALLGILLLSACALEPLKPPPAAQPSATNGTSRPAAPARKEVVELRGLNMLVARDGTSCTVLDQVFRSTRVGDRVTCMWRRQR